MRTVYFIRHGATAGNLQRRYIGRTDEPLCELGINQARELAAKPFPAGTVFVSPMTRTRQTASLVFPGLPQTVIDDLRETDFGQFEAKTADELSENAAYRAWVDAGCETPIPGGEAVADFKARCVAAFRAAMARVPDGETCFFVIHGGCIMSILEALAVPKQDFYAYHVGNCCFLKSLWDGRALTVER